MSELYSLIAAIGYLKFTIKSIILLLFINYVLYNVYIKKFVMTKDVYANCVVFFSQRDGCSIFNSTSQVIKHGIV